MATALPILLLLGAFGLMALEVFVPSFGVLTMASVGCFVASLVLGFGQDETLGWSLLVVAVFGIPVLLVLSFKLFPRTPLGKHMMLFGPRRHPAPATRADRTELVGKEGVTRSALRPSGVAVIDGERIDVVTRGEMVGQGVRVKVIENLGNRIVVRAVEPETEEREEKELR